MGYYLRGRRAYDNIAIGSETGEERHVEGGRGYAVNATSVLRERIVTSDAGTTGQASFWEKHVQVAGSSTTDSGWFGVGTEVPGSTSNSSFHTSGTTFVTDVFPERVG